MLSERPYGGARWSTMGPTVRLQKAGSGAGGDRVSSAPLAAVGFIENVGEGGGKCIEHRRGRRQVEGKKEHVMSSMMSAPLHGHHSNCGAPGRLDLTRLSLY